MNRPDHPTLSTAFLSDIQRLDPQQWSRLVSVFAPIVYRWCRTSGIKEHDASDVVQDVFGSVARGIGSFERQKETGSFRSWLATITRNRIRDHLRQQMNRERAAGGTEALRWLRDAEASLDDSVSGETIQQPIVRRVLQEVRAEFETKTWQAFWMSAVEDRVAADVADATGMSVASVYQAKSRVLRRLRARMQELPQ
ncbi:MAG: sigma-70 family RNA polymerase sigma factor [Planctomycetota bacterium]